MDDQQLHDRIRELADEEHRLQQGHVGEGLTDEERARMREIEVSLDRCWDLLRQRRAREDHGDDPDQARVRPADTVENYQQ